MSRNVSLHKSSICGRRNSNEDVERYKLNLSPYGSSIDTSLAPVDFFVICDGHGGKEVADNVAPELEKYFTQPGLQFPVPKQHIDKIYSSIQNNLIHHPNEIARYCGCTALVVLRYNDFQTKNKHVQVINLGDCRAVLSRTGLAIPLCKDHKPFWPDEKKRIRKINQMYGTQREIHYEANDWRIGDLSVSRAFGDLDNLPHVGHRPDVFSYELTDDDEFIVMACDGVWDVLENHEVINFIRDHLYGNQIELYEIPGKFPITQYQDNVARHLADYAFASGSTDNISVLVIPLKNMSKTPR